MALHGNADPTGVPTGGLLGFDDEALAPALRSDSADEVASVSVCVPGGGETVNALFCMTRPRRTVLLG